MPACRRRSLLVVSALLALAAAGCSRGSSPGATPPPPAQGPAVTPPAAPTAEATPEHATGTEDRATPPEDAGAPQRFLVRLSGVRCIAAPCPTHLAEPLGQQGAEPLQVHELDFAAAGLTDAQRDAVLARMDRTPGVKLEARVGVRPKAGPAGDATVLYVTRLLEPAPAR